MALLEIGGDLECRRGSFAEAAKAFREALEFCQRASPGRPRLLRKLATTLAGLGQYAEAHRLLSEFLGLEATSGRELLREIGRARLLLAWTCLTQSKPEQALEHCGGAARVAERIKDHYILATALMWSATAHLLTKSAGEARGALVQAFWKFRALRDKGDVARVLAMLGRVAMLTRKWRQAERLLQRSLPMLRAEGCLDEAARTMVRIGTIHHKLCGWEAAAAQYREARVLYERLGHSRGKAVALVNLSQLNASRGWLDSAVAEAKEALDTAPEDPEFRCHALLCLARAEYALGDLEAAHRAALEALRTATELNLTSQLESAHRILGEVEALRREVSSAREHLQVALSLSERQKMPHREAICLARLAEAAIASGDLATAHSLAESAHQKAAQSEAQPVIAVVDLVKGKIALAAEKPREALDWLRRAHQVFARGGGCDDQVEVTLHLAKAFVALEKFRFAAFYCRAALDIVDQVAARLRSERERALFYADPRRRAVLALIHSLRTQVENREDT
jgi:tetratricopeptide (TPR) repeat protein